jgi:AcrR family transcriptional regulator
MTGYQTIATHFRERISSGALAPGAKLPSTRAVAKRWKVAHATATRALETLKREGLAVAVPRSGMRVAERELSRQRIIDAAVRIADEEGLDALSLRGLAGRLDVPVMSLYRHVRNKSQVISLMAESLIDGGSLPKTPPAGWRAQLEMSTRAEWTMMKKHPWLARVMQINRPHGSKSGLLFADWVLRALDGSSLDAAGKMMVHVLLHSFVQGLAVNLEAEAQARGDTGISDEEHMVETSPQFSAAVASGEVPHFAAVIAGLSGGFDLNVDVLFELGLRVLLDGLARDVK